MAEFADSLPRPFWATSAKRPRSVTATKGSGVYFAAFVTLGGDAYFKIGKSNDVTKRLKQLNTGLPGGVTKCILAPQRSESAAFNQEAWLISMYRGDPSLASPVSGEWFHSPDIGAAELAFREANRDCHEVECFAPAPAKGERVRRNISLRRRRREEVEERLATWRARLEEGSERDPDAPGVCGLYGGTLRG